MGSEMCIRDSSYGEDCVEKKRRASNLVDMLPVSYVPILKTSRTQNCRIGAKLVLRLLIVIMKFQAGTMPVYT